MGFLDGIARFLAETIGLFDATVRRDERNDELTGRPELSEEELDEFRSRDPEGKLEFIQSRGGVDSPVQELLEEVVGGTFDTLEDAIDDELTEGDLTQLTQAEQNLNDAEAVALSEALAVIGGQTAVETLSAGQVDSFETPVAEVLSFLALDDIVGTRIGVTMEEAVLPSLRAEINRRNRTQFVNLQDQIERDLRNKDSDTGYIEDIGTYGIREDQVGLLEEVALNDMEFEELIETPAELGLVVSDDILEAELDRAGYAEETKEFLQRVNNRIKLSARAYQELLVSEDHISDLDQRVEDGTLTVDEALAGIPDQVDVDRNAMRQRFTQKDDLDPQAPSQSDFIDALVEGYTSLDETRDRLDQSELDTDRYEGVLKAEIVGDLDGALQTAVGTGRLSETEFANLAEFTGVDDQVIELLLQGQSLSDIAKARLQESTDPRERSVQTLVGIGESRAAALNAAGLGTVQDLAQADVETIAETAQVSPETAQDFIQAAAQRVN